MRPGTSKQGVENPCAALAFGQPVRGLLEHLFADSRDRYTSFATALLAARGAPCPTLIVPVAHIRRLGQRGWCGVSGRRLLG